MRKLRPTGDIFSSLTIALIQFLVRFELEADNIKPATRAIQLKIRPTKASSIWFSRISKSTI